MAVDMATATKLDLHVPAEIRPGQRTFNVVTVFDGEQYSALCRELGIASDGPTALEAVANVRGAVAEALAVAAEQHISAGHAVGDQTLLEFFATHNGPEAVAHFMFSL